MIHSFDTQVAEVCGIREAVLLYHIDFWITKNKANEKHFYDGRYWTYNSSKAFAKLFPYLTQKVIEKLLARLIANGYLVKGNFSDNVLDRTSWYSLTEKYYYVKMGNCISPNGEIDFSKWGNEYIYITDIINTDNNNIEFEKKVSNETYFSHSLVRNEISHDCVGEQSQDMTPPLEATSQAQSTSEAQPAEETKRGRQGSDSLFEAMPNPKRKQYQAEFEEFWKMYPKKEEKGKAYTLYLQKVPKIISHEELCNRLNQQRKVWEAKRTQMQYIPQCQKWLRNDTFKDNFDEILESYQARFVSHS